MKKTLEEIKLETQELDSVLKQKHAEVSEVLTEIKVLLDYTYAKVKTGHHVPFLHSARAINAKVNEYQFEMDSKSLYNDTLVDSDLAFFKEQRDYLMNNIPSICTS